MNIRYPIYEGVYRILTADVLTFLSEHVKDFRKEDIAFYKARIHNFFQK